MEGKKEKYKAQRKYREKRRKEGIEVMYGISMLARERDEWKKFAESLGMPLATLIRQMIREKMEEVEWKNQ